jgi:hypothetical protein
MESTRNHSETLNKEMFEELLLSVKRAVAIERGHVKRASPSAPDSASRKKNLLLS